MDSLSPSAYQDRCEQLVAAGISRPPGVLQAVLNNPGCRESLTAHSLDWARGYLARFELPGWQLQEGVDLESELHGQTIICRLTLLNPHDPPTMKQNIFARPQTAQPGAPLATAIRTSPPLDREQAPHLAGGVFSRGRPGEHQPGTLYLWKSWTAEELEGLGMEIPWQDPEDADRLVEE